MVFEYKIGEIVPKGKLGVVERYFPNDIVSSATIVGLDDSGTYRYYEVDVKSEKHGKTRISIPVNDLNG
jgi:hypothetical protein